jgi:hypothetical protein
LNPPIAVPLFAGSAKSPFNAAHIRKNITYAARFIETNKLVSGQTLLEPLLRSVIAPFFLISSIYGAKAPYVCADTRDIIWFEFSQDGIGQNI